MTRRPTGQDACARDGVPPAARVLAIAADLVRTAAGAAFVFLLIENAGPLAKDILTEAAAAGPALEVGAHAAFLLCCETAAAVDGATERR